MYVKFGKRLFDFVLALIAFVILSPLLLILIIVGAIAMGGNPFFTQARPGMIDPKTGNERIFRLLKFRSMSNKKDANGNLLPDDERLNKYGRFLRSTSCDELPSLINILKGDLSIVGPRPLLVDYLPYYTKEEHRRHSLRPGLTGYAQVNGRNTTPWDIRLGQDLYYVDHCSFGLDLKVIVKTALKVVKRSDILVGKAIPAGRLDNYRKDKDMKACVSIRPFEKKDVPNKVRWINDDANNTYLHYNLPLNEKDTLAWFERNQGRKDRVDDVIEFEGVPVGIIGLLSVTEESGEYYVTMGESAYKGKGIAKQASRLILEYGFKELGLKEIYLYTEVDNKPAQHLFERCGFRQRGIAENSAMNKGKPVDRYYYSISREEWEDDQRTL